MKMLSVSDADLREAARALSAGKLVAFPTETVYGLGADVFNTPALARVFEAKQRPRFDPLIVHIAELAALERLADLSVLDAQGRSRVSALGEALWPGPLTLVLPKRPEVPDLATSGLPTVAVRFPSHPAAQKIILWSSGAVAAPSANPFGYLSPTRAEHVAEQLGGRVDYIVDGGRTDVGVESTVLDMTESVPRILRPGGMPRERIESIIGRTAVNGGVSREPASPEAPAHSPGMLTSHYAPRTPLLLYAPGEMRTLVYKEGEAYLFFSAAGRERWLQTQGKAAEYGAEAGGGKNRLSRIRVLSEEGSLTEAAANLFDILHDLDKAGTERIRAERVSDEGLGRAINDRLRRAAAESKIFPDHSFLQNV
ncbi:threonylcarbamoyl-AMP synthase [Treponema sp. OttesenSCG-928-L16]|nr:threonylcarbamoyl-AMP synthase [Treponema sp. OttesenSCG-928-L16]